MNDYAISDLMDYMRRYLIDCDGEKQEANFRGFYNWMKNHGH